MILMGSNFWKINNEKSDRDFIDYIMPSKDDLFYCNMCSKVRVDPNGDDYNTKDIRMLLKELAKGSLISFQVLYSNDTVIDIKANSCLSYARECREELFKELKPNLMRAVYGEMRGDISKLARVNDIDKINKIKGNIFKLDYVLNWLNDGKNPFIEWFKNEEVIKRCKDIRSGVVALDDEEVIDILERIEKMKFTDKVFVETCSTFNELKAYVKDMIF